MQAQTCGSAATLAPTADTPREKKGFPQVSPESMRFRPTTALDEHPTPLIVVSPFDEDFISLLDILTPSEWTIHWSSTHCEAIRLLHDRRVPVVLCERELPDGEWRRLADNAQCLPQPPRIIVTARHADERLWIEALNVGAHDVLRKPFDRGEVNRVVRHARQFWNAARKETKHNAKRVRHA